MYLAFLLIVLMVGTPFYYNKPDVILLLCELITFNACGFLISSFQELGLYPEAIIMLLK